jgi:hypothetical protein
MYVLQQTLVSVSEGGVANKPFRKFQLKLYTSQPSNPAHEMV